mmetsp:Transcript_24643/g.68717  ORF Transcript_24643/g.68717 Transcript_24643/m.68717 type:complete len:322 (-) Transcript_24643:427-1392(-)
MEKLRGPSQDRQGPFGEPPAHLGRRCRLHRCRTKSISRRARGATSVRARRRSSARSVQVRGRSARNIHRFRRKELELIHAEEFIERGDGGLRRALRSHHCGICGLLCHGHLRVLVLRACAGLRSGGAAPSGASVRGEAFESRRCMPTEGLESLGKELLGVGELSVERFKPFLGLTMQLLKFILNLFSRLLRGAAPFLGLAMELFEPTPHLLGCLFCGASPLLAGLREARPEFCDGGLQAPQALTRVLASALADFVPAFPVMAQRFPQMLPHLGEPSANLAEQSPQLWKRFIPTRPAAALTAAGTVTEKTTNCSVHAAARSE